MSKETHVFYHASDLDGWCSGAIAKYFLPKAILHPFEYGNKIPEDVINDNTVLLFDVIPNPIEQIIDLNKRCDFFAVIDHHKTSIDYIDSLSNIIFGQREIGKSACELAWRYFNDDEGNLKTPHIVTLLGRYDVWDKSNIDKWNNIILPFQKAIKLYATDPSIDMGFWECWFKVDNNDRIFDITIRDGAMLSNYDKKNNVDMCNSFSFKSILDNKKALCINSFPKNSTLFESKWNNKIYDLMFRYNFNGKEFYVSLYTDKEGIDVSEIAKKYGGGGHKQAAGFSCKQIDFSNDQIKIVN